MSRTMMNDVPNTFRAYEQAQEVSLDEIPAKVHRPFDKWSDDFAAKVVRQDFDTSSQFRQNNHDFRWIKADGLYAGYKKQKYWNGTGVPKANIPVYVVFQQVESLLPRALAALFGDNPWFEAKPGLGSKPKAATKVRDILSSQIQLSSPREQMRRVIKSGIKYGDGILMTGWLHKEGEVLQYTPDFIPMRKPQMDPINNRFIQVPTGEYHRIIRETSLHETENRPFWKYVSIKNIYVDPDAEGPNINDDCRYIIHRTFPTIDYLDSLRDEPGFESMPDRQYLLMLARARMLDGADDTKQQAEAVRGVTYNPYEDVSADPGAQKIETLIYHTKDRQVWLLNRAMTVFNKPNPLGRIHYYHIPWADMMDRFYGMGVADISEGEQRVQEGLISARLNELALAIDPMTVRQKGGSTSIYEVRVRPGGIVSTGASDAKSDIIRQFPLMATANTSMEVQASELRDQRATGVSDLAMMGVGTPQNPAARTAQGAGLQGQAAFSRVLYFVENISEQIVEPALNDTYEWDRKFLDPNQLIEGIKGEGIDPLEIWGAKVRFEMRSGSRMAARTSLLQVLPMIMQSVMNPALMEQLHSLGKTVNFVEIMQMIMDATGYKEKVEWISDLTPQQMQALQQKNVDPNKMIDFQMQDKRMGQMHESMIDKEEQTTYRTIIQGVLDHMKQEKINQARVLGNKGQGK